MRISALWTVAAVCLVACGPSGHTSTPGSVVASSARSVSDLTTDNYLSGIACRTTTDCIAVGYLAEGIDTIGPATRTLMLENSGGGWKIVHSPNATGRTGSSLSGITCLASGKCIAVGSSEDEGSNPLTLIEESGAEGWTIVPSPNPTAFGDVGSLNAVACSTLSRCVAVGSYESETGYQQTLVEENRGQGWVLMPSPNTSGYEDNRLSAIACPSQSLCIAVGWHGATGGKEQPLIERDSGSGWTIVSATGVGRLSGIACLGVTWCVATGGNFAISSEITEQPIIEEMADGAWTVAGTSQAIGTLGGVACPTTNYCISVGSVLTARLGGNIGPVITAERDNGAWTIGHPPIFGSNVEAFDSVACPTSSRCIGVGHQLVLGGAYVEPRATLIAERTGAGWTVDSTPSI